MYIANNVLVSVFGVDVCSRGRARKPIQLWTFPFRRIPAYARRVPISSLVTLCVEHVNFIIDFGSLRAIVHTKYLAAHYSRCAPPNIFAPSQSPIYVRYIFIYITLLRSTQHTALNFSMPRPSLSIVSCFVCIRGAIANPHGSRRRRARTIVLKTRRPQICGAQIFYTYPRYSIGERRRAVAYIISPFTSKLYIYLLLFAMRVQRNRNTYIYSVFFKWSPQMRVRNRNVLYQGARTRLLLEQSWNLCRIYI